MNKVSIYDQVTNDIITLLENEVLPWVCPWAGGFELPQNGHSLNEYRGINTLILWVSSMMNEYHSNSWMTYKQASEKGGQVRKGSKGTPIIYYQLTEKEDPKTKEKTEFPVIRRYTVFNVEQIEGIEDESINEVSSLSEIKREELAERFLKNISFKLEQGPQKAFFHKTKDIINMPKTESFKSSEGYYSTIFHELVHWTGHESRLNREAKKGYSEKEAYAFEELVAEIGAAFLSAEFKIDYLAQHASYIDSWLTVLKKDNRAIFAAAAQAKKAVDYLSSFQPMEIKEVI